MQVQTSATQIQQHTSALQAMQQNTLKSKLTSEPTEFPTSMNQHAGDYIELDMDLSAYTKIDPVQEQTNRELYEYLLKVMDEDTSAQKPWNGFHNTELNVSIAGKKENFTAFQAELFFNRAFAFEDHAKSLDQNYLKEVSKKMLEDMLAYKSKGAIKVVTVSTSATQNSSSLKPWEIQVPENAQRLDGFKTASKEDAIKKGIESLINMYNLTEEFTKSEKFQEFLEEYTQKKGEIIETAHAEGKSYDSYLGNSLEEHLLDEIAKNARSKSEIIEYYNSISNDLRELIQHYEDSPHMSLSKNVIEDMNKSINLYERMSHDLKEMWGYGELDLYS